MLDLMMRRARPWLPGQRRESFEGRFGRRALMKDGAGIVALAEDHVVIGDDRRRLRQAPGRVPEPGLEPGERLSQRGCDHRAAFHVIAVEQFRPRLTAHDQSQLPGEVVRIVNAGIAAEGAGWRHQMRRIADKEATAFAKALGDLGGQRPGARIDQFGLDLRASGALSDQLAAAVRVEILRPVAILGKILQRQQPTPFAAWGERGVEVGDEAGGEALAIEGRRQVGVEDQVHPVLQHARTAHADAETLAQRAAGAVRDDQIIGDDGLLGSAGPVANPGADLPFVLFEALELGVEAHGRAEPLRMAPQDRLQHVLVAGRRLGRAVRRGVGPADLAPLDLGIGQVSRPGDAAALLVAGAPGADFRFQPEAAEDFHAAWRDPGELVLDRGSGMTLDNHAVDAMVGEQRGGRESIQAAADNKDASAGAHDGFLWNDKAFAICGRRAKAPCGTARWADDN
ncbi:hypothetical protein BOS5A_200035 [Bosea sp. EC-HK365B]|nr:conserved hypothetical protein [Bosea sp. 21B]CAD5287018.1 conserved hypothetical protein [Bosea sp. 7B]VVT57340.1 hypothetical protein BOS5A_200035 [Bosea sp. EC-HK365B]VXC95327.1 conserved hypothetical protein [Bosea sp. 127]